MQFRYTFLTIPGIKYCSCYVNNNILDRFEKFLNEEKIEFISIRGMEEETFNDISFIFEGNSHDYKKYTAFDKISEIFDKFEGR